MMKPSHSTKALVSAAALLVVTACSEGPLTAPAEMKLAGSEASATGDVLSPAQLFGDPLLWARQVWACKVGPSANFEVSVDLSSPVLKTIEDGTCQSMHFNDGATFAVDSVTVSELPSLEFVLDSVNVKLTRYGIIQSSTTLIGPNATSVIVTVPPNPLDGKGGIVTFYNSPVLPPPPPPGGGQGCTPGYWKQTQHFDSWVGYSPNQLFSSVFEDAFPGKTLLQVVSQGGGGLNALGRHTVAALLNTANAGVSYDLSTAQVIAGFNGVFPGGDYEGQKNIFAAFNEQGCSIN